MDSTKPQQSLGPVEMEGLQKCRVYCLQANDKLVLPVLNKTKPGLGKLTSAPWGSQSQPPSVAACGGEVKPQPPRGSFKGQSLTVF